MHAWLKNNKIAIWGYGREGQATLAYLRARTGSSNITIIADDVDPASVPVAVLPNAAGVVQIAAGDFDVVIKSPGISLYDSAVLQAKAQGTIITSATNLWFEAHPAAKTIVITGTKGKSTTASLMHHVLQQLSADATLAGNIGTPALSITPGGDYTVLELSSYQLADLVYPPAYFMVLNLFPEHLPWHRSKQQYYADKLSPARHHGTQVIANAGNADVTAGLRHIPGISWFNEGEGYRVRDGQLFSGQQPRACDWCLKGAHNLENLAAVLTLCDVLGYRADDVLRAASSFTPLPHRLQEYRGVDGVLYVNDSIATTPEATLAALKAYANKPIILILGGTDRGQDYREFAKKIGNYHIKAVYVLPANGSQIAEALAGYQEVRPAETLAAAVADLKQYASAGDVVLLSPAAPSFSQFRNFEARGDHFMALVRDGD